MNASREDDEGPSRRVTYGDEPPVHQADDFMAAMAELIPDDDERRAFIRNGIEWELVQDVVLHAANPRDGKVGRSDWLGSDAIFLTVNNYFQIRQIMVFAHYERETDGIHVWLDDARPGLQALEEEDESG